MDVQPSNPSRRRRAGTRLPFGPGRRWRGASSHSRSFGFNSASHGPRTDTPAIQAGAPAAATAFWRVAPRAPPETATHRGTRACPAARPRLRVPQTSLFLQPRARNEADWHSATKFSRGCVRAQAAPASRSRSLSRGVEAGEHGRFAPQVVRPAVGNPRDVLGHEILERTDRFPLADRIGMFARPPPDGERQPVPPCDLRVALGFARAFYGHPRATTSRAESSAVGPS